MRIYLDTPNNNDPSHQKSFQNYNSSIPSSSSARQPKLALFGYNSVRLAEKQKKMEETLKTAAIRRKSNDDDVDNDNKKKLKEPKKQEPEQVSARYRLDDNFSQRPKNNNSNETPQILFSAEEIRKIFQERQVQQAKARIEREKAKLKRLEQQKKIESVLGKKVPSSKIFKSQDKYEEHKKQRQFEMEQEERLLNNAQKDLEKEMMSRTSRSPSPNNNQEQHPQWFAKLVKNQRPESVTYETGNEQEQTHQANFSEFKLISRSKQQHEQEELDSTSRGGERKSFSPSSRAIHNASVSVASLSSARQRDFSSLPLVARPPSVIEKEHENLIQHQQQEKEVVIINQKKSAGSVVVPRPPSAASSKQYQQQRPLTAKTRLERSRQLMEKALRLGEEAKFNGRHIWKNGIKTVQQEEEEISARRQQQNQKRYPSSEMMNLNQLFKHRTRFMVANDEQGGIEMKKPAIFVSGNHVDTSSARLAHSARRPSSAATSATKYFAYEVSPSAEEVCSARNNNNDNNNSASMMISSYYSPSPRTNNNNNVDDDDVVDYFYFNENAESDEPEIHPATRQRLFRPSYVTVAPCAFSSGFVHTRNKKVADICLTEVSRHHSLNIGAAVRKLNRNNYKNDNNNNVVPVPVEFTAAE